MKISFKPIPGSPTKQTKVLCLSSGDKWLSLSNFETNNFLIGLDCVATPPLKFLFPTSGLIFTLHSILVCPKIDRCHGKRNNLLFIADTIFEYQEHCVRCIPSICDMPPAMRILISRLSDYPGPFSNTTQQRRRFLGKTRLQNRAYTFVHVIQQWSLFRASTTNIVGEEKDSGLFYFVGIKLQTDTIIISIVRNFVVTMIMSVLHVCVQKIDISKLFVSSRIHNLELYS